MAPVEIPTLCDEPCIEFFYISDTKDRVIVWCPN